ncbi:PREDICTED: uncharacterized protein LOC109152098 [Ipomoea nil]|uniref:uncharacterized protein LOC109152098 n=1 Tax=Ipomoea nil TaxID=35883 RepID=UPI000900BFA0|nr:PREDICTED: uncharacterized protein LOC109152098 [Ipomoea nil]
MYEEFLHLKQEMATVMEYHNRFLELARFTPELVPTETTKIEKFVTGFNFETRKALIVSKPRTLNEAYTRAAKLYRIQILQRGVQEQTRKRNTGSGGPPVKTARNDANTRTVNPPNQGSSIRNNEHNVRPFLCRRCNKDHRGKDCIGNALQCFNYGGEGHKAFRCTQSPSARPTVMAQQGNANNRGNYGALG